MEVAIYKNLACKMSDDFAHIVLCPFWRTFLSANAFLILLQEQTYLSSGEEKPRTNDPGNGNGDFGNLLIVGMLSYLFHILIFSICKTKT